MSIHEANTHELHGDGMIIIDGETVETVFYWLTIAPEPGPVLAEGSISGSEALLRKLKKAGEVKLAFEDGPVVAIRCEGGHNGTRWVKALKT